MSTVCNLGNELHYRPVVPDNIIVISSASCYTGTGL